MTWQKLRVDIPEELSLSQREEAAQAMVDQIVNNAVEGKGVKGDSDKFTRAKFPAYSKAYEAKKGQKNVDLTLSGEMLSALKVISTKKGSVLLGFDNGSEANAKAEGNILGSYGREPNSKKARNFLGLIPSEIRQIVSKIKKG